MKVYQLLNGEARRWWYHRELRERGQHEEARRRERESIKRNAFSLRKARADGWLLVGRGGWTLHYEDGKSSVRVQGYGGLGEAIPQCALILGIPVIDSTTIPDGLIAATVSLPMATTRTEEIGRPPWGALSYAPLEDVAAAELALGATVYNLDVPPLDVSKFSGMSDTEGKALRSYQTGDAVGVFQAMHELRSGREVRA